MKPRYFLFAPEGDPPGGGGAPPPTLIPAGGGDGGGGSPPPAPSSWSWASEDGTLAADWQSKLPDDLKENPSLKTINNLPLLAKAYVETKSLVGKKLEAPGEGATPEQLTAWRKVLGTPDTVEGYLGDAKTLRPETIPEDIWDTENEKQFLALAHKHHLPPAAVKEILGFYGESLIQGVKQSQAGEGEFLAKEGAALKQAWGADFERNLNSASSVAKMVGLDPATHPIFQSSEVVQAFAKFASFLSEDKLVAGGGGISNTIQSRIQDITDPKSQSQIAREYRGEFGPERQAAAQGQYHNLLNAQPKK